MATSLQQASRMGGWIGTLRSDRPGPSDKFRSDAFTTCRADSTRDPHDGLLETREALLRSIVETEILPRLSPNLHPVVVADAGAIPGASDESTLAFVHVLLTQEAPQAVALIDALRQAGATPAALYLGVITRAARHLGDLWLQDRCDFTQVTISMGRLQRVLRTLSPHFQMDAVFRTQAEHLLLVPSPGEQHTFGLLMLAEFFVREGWRVAGGPTTSDRDATDMVRRTWFDVAGFSIGSVARVDGLRRCIRSVRRASRNPNLCVMVGGPLFLTTPDLAAQVGADFAAMDAPGAVRQAHGLTAAKGQRLKV